MNQEKEYYEKVAEACDTLLPAKGENLTGERRISADQITLPVVLRELDPNLIYVSSNSVSVLMGKPKLIYGVVWSQNDENPSMWELSLNGGEGPPKIMFSKLKVDKFVPALLPIDVNK